MQASSQLFSHHDADQELSAWDLGPERIMRHCLRDGTNLEPALGDRSPMQSTSTHPTRFGILLSKSAISENVSLFAMHKTRNIKGRANMRQSPHTKEQFFSDARHGTFSMTSWQSSGGKRAQSLADGAESVM